jgi:tetratricopeptide (TPR) repeat protein
MAGEINGPEQSRRGQLNKCAAMVIESAPAAKPQGAFSKLLVCLCLTLVTVAIYAPVYHYQFVNLDDGKYIAEDADVVRGFTFEGLGRAFTHFHFCNWHPVTTLSQMLDCQLWGLDAGGHHLTNVFFHTANAVLLFLVLGNMTGATWRSALVAALFAWHPLHVESVAWISDRKDLLSAFFLMLTLGAYTWYVRRPQWHSYLLALTCYTLGLMSKATLVPLPLLLLLLDYWPLGRLRFGGSTGLSRETPRPLPVLIREKLPFFALAGVFSVVASFAQQSGGALSSLEKLSFSNRLANALLNYVVYILRTLWPTDLAIPYPIHLDLPLWKVLGSGLVIVLTTTLIVRARRRSAFLAVGWFWYLIALLPVIGLVQVGMQTMADRYTYVPSVGIFIAVVWGMGEALTRWRLPKTPAALGTGLVLAGCVILTRSQLSYWQDSETLLRHAIAATENNAFACYNLGCYLESKDQVALAMENYRWAIQINPNYAKALNNLGKLLATEGRVDEAMEYYHRALYFDPEHVSALNNLGAALADKRQFTEAMAMYEKALRLDPGFVPARYNLGIALEAKGRWEEAIVQYTEALRAKPDYWQAHNNLGYVLMLHGRMDEAVRHYTESLRLNANQPNIHFNLGNALAMQRQYAEAVMQFAECLKLSPNYAPAHKNLGMALARLGRREEAVSHLQEAIRLKPDYEEAIRQIRALEGQNGGDITNAAMTH